MQQQDLGKKYSRGVGRLEREQQQNLGGRRKVEEQQGGDAALVAALMEGAADVVVLWRGWRCWAALVEAWEGADDGWRWVRWC